MQQKILVVASFLLFFFMQSISLSGQCAGQPDGTPCDDGDACTTNDVCMGGVCVGAEPTDCNDGNTCTDDLCDPIIGCVHIDNTISCDDGNECTFADQCVGGACEGTPISCDDGDPNTVDTCDPLTGDCLNTPLPVELVDFAAQVRLGEVLLLWQTATEINNAGFEIQRSVDASNWQRIGFIAGLGTSFTTKSYRFEDPSPSSGLNYYRLQQVDLDGKSEYSEIISVEFGYAEKSMLLFPNPSEGVVNIQINNPSNERVLIEVTTNLGRTIWAHEFVERGMNWETEITLREGGVYYVSVIIGDETYQERVLILN